MLVQAPSARVRLNGTILIPGGSYWRKLPINEAAMNEVINGQIVPALGQWQGAVLIIVTLAVAYLLERLRGRSKSN